MNKTDTRPVVEAFYGISSPWAYLGFPKLRQIVAQEGASLILRPIRIIQANGAFLCAQGLSRVRNITVWNYVGGVTS